MTTYNLLTQPVWTIRDEDGNPVSYGTATFYKATDHGTLKAIYTTREGDTALPNPHTLTKAGTMPIPYGADDEAYYVEIRTAEDALVLIIDDFNADVAFEEELIEEGEFTKNYILNGQFRFFDTQAFSSSDFVATVETIIADNGWGFIRDGSTSALDLEFKPFTAGQSDAPETPTYYMYINKVGAINENYCDILYKLGRVQDFADKEVIISFTGKSATAAAVYVIVENNFGWGGSGTTNTQQIQPLSFDNTWDKATVQFRMPDIAGKTIGTEGDDFVRLRFRLPLNQAVELFLTNGQYNIGDVPAPFEFKSYYQDLIERNGYLLPPSPMDENQFSFLISDGEKYIFENFTGSIIHSSKGSPYPGYIEADGTTVVRTDNVVIPGGTAKVTYDRLYQAWENDSVLGNGNAYGYGENGFFPMTYSGTMVMVNEKEEKAITAWADASSPYDTGFTFSQIRAGANYQFNTEFISEMAVDGHYTADHTHADEFLQILTVINNNPAAAPDATIGTLNSYAPVLGITKITDGDGSTPEIVQLAFTHTSAVDSPAANPLYFIIHSPTTAYKVYYVIDNRGSVPTGTETKVRVNLDSGFSRTEFLQATKAALESTGAFTVIHQLALHVENQQIGTYLSTPNVQTSRLTFYGVILGSSIGFAATTMVSIPAQYMVAGSYFDFANTTTDYRYWFTIDGVGTAPAAGGRTLVQIELNSTDDSVAVLWRIAQALKGKACNRIVCSGATGLEGKAFLFENDGGQFYTYYTVDGVGADPGIPLRIPVKTELTASDDAKAVAEATAKTISSYYFKIPNYNGYFLRPFDDTGDVDTGATLRLPRDDGNARALLGTLQADSNRAHSPPLLGQSWTDTDCDGLPVSNTIAGRIISSNNYYRLTYSTSPTNHQIPFIETTGFEARPKNITVKVFIKF